MAWRIASVDLAHVHVLVVVVIIIRTPATQHAHQLHGHLICLLRSRGSPRSCVKGRAVASPSSSSFWERFAPPLPLFRPSLIPVQQRVSPHGGPRR